MSNINVSTDTGNQNLSLDLNAHTNSNNSNIIGIELLANPDKARTVESPINNSSDNTYVLNDDFKLFETDNITNHNPDSNTDNKNIKINSDPSLNNINDNLMSNMENNSGFKSINSMNSQDIKNEKIDLLYKFKRLESQGIKPTMNYNMNSHLDDMRNEYIKLKKQREVDASVKVQRKIMMAAITGLEFLNNKFDPFTVKLDGWSESVNENIYDYDEVFEELYEKYGGAGEVAPEIKLLMMLGGSAFMFHLSKTMFSTGMPSMGDILKNNPDMMKQFTKAAMGNAMGIDPNASNNNNNKENRTEMNGPTISDIDEFIPNMDNLDIDLDNISLISDGSNGITLDINNY